MFSSLLQTLRTISLLNCWLGICISVTWELLYCMAPGYRGSYVDHHSRWVCVQMEDLDCIMATVGGGGGIISGICVAAKVTVIIIM